MVATRTPGSWPRKSRLAASRPPDESLDQRHHSLAAEGLGETLGTTFGDHNMAVVKQPIHGGTGECLGHERVEPGRMDVGGDREAAALIGRIRDPVESLGLGLTGRQHPDVINDDEIGAADPLNHLGCGRIDLGSIDRLR